MKPIMRASVFGLIAASLVSAGWVPPKIGKACEPEFVEGDMQCTRYFDATLKCEDNKWKEVDKCSDNQHCLHFDKDPMMGLTHAVARCVDGGPPKGFEGAQWKCDLNKVESVCDETKRFVWKCGSTPVPDEWDGGNVVHCRPTGDPNDIQCKTLEPDGEDYLIPRATCERDWKSQDYFLEFE